MEVIYYICCHRWLGFEDRGKQTLRLALDDMYDVACGIARLGWAFGGGGGRKVPAAHNSKTINNNEMKFGGIVENYKLINLA